MADPVDELVEVAGFGLVALLVINVLNSRGSTQASVQNSLAGAGLSAPYANTSAAGALVDQSYANQPGLTLLANGQGSLGPA